MTVYNFVTNFGAAVDPADSSPALATWLATAADGDELVIPAGTYHWASTNSPTFGLKNATITATGASVDVLYIGSGAGVQQDYAHSARIQTVNAGATSVTVISSGGTLIAPADASIFSIGQWIMLSGLALQVPDSNPPNFQYLEFRKITGIAGQVISWSVTEPLLFSYKSTWPYIDAFVVTINIGTSTLTCANHALAEGQPSKLTTSGALPTGLIPGGSGYYVKNLSGTSFQLSAAQFGAPISLSGTQSGTHYYHSNALDLGGPATIYGMLDAFDGTQTYTGITCTRVTPGQGIICGQVKSLILNNVSFVNNGGAVPTMAKSVVLNNCQIGEQNEVDKCVSYLEYNGCTATGIKQIELFNAAITELVIKNTVIDTLNGTAFNTTIKDSTIGTIIGGPTAYGRANSLLITNSSIGPANPSSGTRPSTHFCNLSQVTFSNQTFTVANGGGNLDDVLRLFIPGFKYAIGFTTANLINIVDNLGKTTYFTVLDVTQDDTNTYILTNLSALPVGVTYAGSAANAIFAYGVKTLNVDPPNLFLSSINAFVEPIAIDIPKGPAVRSKQPHPVRSVRTKSFK